MSFIDTQCTSIISPVALTSSDTSLKSQGTNIDYVLHIVSY